MLWNNKIMILDTSNSMCELTKKYQTIRSVPAKLVHTDDRIKNGNIKIPENDLYFCEICNLQFDEHNKKNKLKFLNHLNEHYHSKSHMETLSQLCTYAESSNSSKIGEEKKQSLMFEFMNNLSVTESNLNYFNKDESITKLAALPMVMSCGSAREDSGLILPRDVYVEISTLFRKSLLKPNLLKKDATKKCAKHRDEGTIAQNFNKKYQAKKYLQLKIEDLIFSCNEKNLFSLASSLKLLIPNNNESVRCLACNKDVSNDNLYEHLMLTPHLIKLRVIHEDSNLCKLYEQNMMIINKKIIKCMSCKINIANNSKCIDIHIKSKTHETKHMNLQRVIKNTFSPMLKDVQDFWYNIQRFCCIKCKLHFDYQFEFINHIIWDHFEDTLDNNMFDFCIQCGILWLSLENNFLGYFTDYFGHCNDVMHKYVCKTKFFEIDPLPKCIERLLMDVDETVETLYHLAKKVLQNYIIQKKIKQSLEDALKTHYPYGELQLYGSTNYYEGVFEGDAYHCKKKLLSTLELLPEQEKEWKIIEAKDFINPILCVRHKKMNLCINILFETFSNTNYVESIKLIWLYNDIYPSCQKLIQFFQKWLTLCALPEKLASCGVAWIFIFFLQVKLIVPSVYDLLKLKNESRQINEWKIGVARPNNKPVKSIPKLLLEFFEYYGAFNYQAYVICPFIGKKLTKRSFADPDSLSEEMEPYVSYFKNPANSKYFQMEISPLCVQDPFLPSHNLMEAVNIITLKAFKRYCLESALILLNLIAK